MNKINIKDLSPVAEEVIVTGKIGDKSVRQYIKENNIVKEIVDMRQSGFNDSEVEDVLVDSLPTNINLDDAVKRAKEIVELTREEVDKIVAEQNESVFEFSEETKLAIEGR